MVNLFGFMLLAIAEFVVMQVLLVTMIGVISIALSFMKSQWFIAAASPAMLLQPVKTAFVLTPVFLLTTVLLVQVRRGIPVLVLTEVPPALMKALTPLLVFSLAFGCRQVNGLIEVFVLTMVSDLRACMIAVPLLILMLISAALGLTIVLDVMDAVFLRSALGRTAMLGVRLMALRSYAAVGLMTAMLVSRYPLIKCWPNLWSRAVSRMWLPIFLARYWLLSISLCIVWLTSWVQAITLARHSLPRVPPAASDVSLECSMLVLNMQTLVPTLWTLVRVLAVLPLLMTVVMSLFLLLCMTWLQLNGLLRTDARTAMVLLLVWRALIRPTSALFASNGMLLQAMMILLVRLVSGVRL